MQTPSPRRTAAAGPGMWTNRPRMPAQRPVVLTKQSLQLAAVIPTRVTHRAVHAAAVPGQPGGGWAESRVDVLAVAEIEELALERAAHARVEQLAAERAAILGQIAEGIVIADPTGRITFVNDAAQRIHGIAELGVPVGAYSETYHLLTMDGQFFPAEDLPLARAVLRGETVVDAQWRIRRPDGREIIAQGSAAPVTGEDGRLLGAVLTVTIMLIPAGRCRAEPPSIAIGHAQLVAGCRDAIR